MTLAMVLSSLHAYAQHEVQGRVVNSATGQGFAGVSITSPGLRVSAMTDEDGRFTISLPSLQIPLEVVAPGFAHQLVPVQGRQELVIHIARKGGANYYDQGIDTHQAVATTGSLQEGSITVLDDLTSTLLGQVQTTRRSGEPGASATLYVRGVNSLNLTTQPLYVVDGVIWQQQEELGCSVDGYRNDPLTLLDPADIESVQVLKNGSAIWGAKGANGVVLITTKRGREQATRIEANISMGLQTPFTTIPVMGAADYRRYATGLMGTMDKAEAQKFLFTQDDPTKSYYNDTHNRTDWVDQITRPSFIQNYGISVSGGDNIALYRFSLGFAQNDGNIDGTRFNRLNVRFNSDINFTDHFNVMADIAYSQTNRRTAFEGLDGVRSPYLIALQKSPLYGPYQYNLDGSLSKRLSDTDELGVGNPLQLTGDNLPSLGKYRFNLNLRPTYRFTDKWALTGLFGFTWDKTNEDLFLRDTGLAEEELVNEQGEIYAIGRNQVRNYMARHGALSGDAHLSYHPLQDWHHDLQLMLGGRFYQVYNRYNYGLGYNTGSDYIRVLGSTSSDLRYPDGFEYKDRNGAWYFQGTYDFMHRFYLDAQLSLESSNRFGNKADGLSIGHVSWALSPSIQGAWVMSNEKWMKNSGIDHMQWRVGYTQSVNDNLPLFATRNYFSSAVLARDAQGLVLKHVGNPELKWETTGRFDLGFDLSTLHNRLSVHADYYRNVTRDLVVQKSLSNLSGVENYWTNDGTLHNEGFEVAVQGRVVEHRDWRLDMGFQIGHNVNRVTHLGTGSYVTQYGDAQVLTEEGAPVGRFYGFRTNGVYSTSAEAAADGLSIQNASGHLTPFGAGDVRFVDQDGDGIISDADRTVIGDPNPDFFGNMSFRLSYARWALEGIFTYSYGGEAYNAMRATLESGKSLANQSTALLGRWTAEGQQTDVPRATYGDPMGNGRFSDRWIESTSYLRFQRLQLSYDVPLRRHFLQGVNLWAAVNDIFTVTPYLGADPTFSFSTRGLYQGIDLGLTPQSRSYMIGVKFNL